MPAKTLKDIKAIIFFGVQHPQLLCAALPIATLYFPQQKSLKITQMCFYNNCAHKSCGNDLDVTRLLQQEDKNKVVN